MNVLIFALVLLALGGLTWILPLPLIIGTVIVAIFLSDADLTLTICQWIGKKPSALQGKVVWITGASSGIGEALAYHLAKLGCKLILSARRESELERVRQKCAELSPPDFTNSHMVLAVDLTAWEQHKDCASRVMDKYGRIDHLVNNAGRSQIALAADTALDVDRAILDVNTVGTISLTKAVLPHLMKQKGGQIVVVSSLMGVWGASYYAAYAASKHALHGYFNGLRIELSEHNIDVLTVCPGPVESQVIENALSGNLDTSVSGVPKPEPGVVMTAERCAYLMSVAMANRLHEVWVVKRPLNLMTYLGQYMPDSAKWFGVIVVAKLMKKRYSLQN